MAVRETGEIVSTTPEYGFLLDGKWHLDGEHIEVRSPGTGQIVGTTRRATDVHAEAAIVAAARAFEATRRLGGYERQRVLRGVAVGVEQNREEFSRLLALEAGKPIKTARTEVDRAIFTFTVAAEEAVRIGG
ncbi:MAG TPA: aldehyde dehydrogenase family protein, partial [Candidatus Acidoferrales bacterium]|nr:aldehyde dehydrogenase family protein [Candidatus Acidoferrales bacterium]